MINLEYHSTDITFLNITKKDLPIVLDWYNNISDNMYGTGIDKPLTLNDLGKKYLETAISCYDFFLWIVNNNNEKIGIIKGSIKYQESDSIWINSLIIDKSHRNRGYGRGAVEALTRYIGQYFKLSKVCVSVVEDNKDGIAFWNRIGFIPVKRMEKHILLGDLLRDVVIMYKPL